jgi:hypothetical protein
MKVRAVGLVTGWGEGTAALPGDARAAAGERTVVVAPRPGVDAERFRRATRECLLGVSAVLALLRQSGLAPPAVAGTATALLYVTASAYAASNRAFIEGAGTGTLHFPYTAPSAVPAVVAIEFGITGSYAILIGGAAATIDALWQASMLLGRGICERAVVLAVETFEACEDLYARGRCGLGRPLVEAAAAALLVPGTPVPAFGPASTASALDREVAKRAGETLACAPLIALALAGEGDGAPTRVTGRWRGRHTAVTWQGVS